jgi:agmatine deiminase
LGVTNFIWLNGTKGLDITDDHIDDTARFACGDTIVTMARDDFDDPKEYDVLSRATNVQGKKYNLVHVPLTTQKIEQAGEYGSYVNFYVGNQVVLVPAYNDPNDAVAVPIFQTLYPGKQIVSIPMATVLKDGGMIHCVTQQQPLAGPLFTMPPEEDPHEGTWLQWPHNEGRTKYDRKRKRLERYEESWIQMSLALHTGERVHIVVYDQSALERVRGILSQRGCDMTKIDLFAWPTNDVWVRDNGPVFVFDQKNDLHITDWAFNGWGGKVDFDDCNQIPRRVAQALDLPITTIPMVNEGGSVEVDGHGTLMAKRSSILNKNRNKGWTQDDAEAYFYRYLGVTNFIWLDGTKGADITDDHIDGTARFACDNTIVTFAHEDFIERKEYDILANAKNANGKKYKLVHLPVTTKKVFKGDYGVYINFYVGNKVVLLPTYDDPSDTVAIAILQKLYSPTGRKIVGVPMSEVAKDGGMVHCVTQQQPAARNPVSRK